jgi:N-acetylneuraminate synthase/pseudaminic acid synthase
VNLQIGKTLIGDGCPVFVVAEISANHGGKLSVALDLIRAAKDAGANAIKLQTYKPETITLKCSNPDFLLPPNSPWAHVQNLWDLYESAYTPWEWHIQLFEEARNLGLEIFSSPFDETAVDFLEQLDCSAYKIASPEITHIPLLKKVASTKKPIILSSGVSDLNDLIIAIEALTSNGCEELVLLKCNSSYPAPMDESNLLTIADMKDRFGALIGLSDHSIGIVSSVVSVSLGASLVEKHITNNIDGVDSFFSADVAEFSRMVEAIRSAELALGCVSYDVTESASASYRGRRSIYVSQFIGSGETITKNNVKIVRPNLGLHPSYYEFILGKKVNRNFYPGDRLMIDGIDGAN